MASVLIGPTTKTTTITTLRRTKEVIHTKQRNNLKIMVYCCGKATNYIKNKFLPIQKEYFINIAAVSLQISV
jgi:hypothetical protein